MKAHGLYLAFFGALLLAAAHGVVDEDSGATETRPHVKCNKHESSRLSCQNFARFNIHTVNGLINKHRNASYTYQAMGKYFDRDDVAYRGFGKFFQHMAHETREGTDNLMSYLSKRGGYHSYKAIPDPKTTWSGPEDALTDSLAIEKYLQTATLDLHWDAREKNDPHLQHYLESDHLDSRVGVIKDVSSLLSRTTRLALIPLGLHILDEELHSRDY